MLSKQNRLKKKKDFENVIKNGLYAAGKFLILKFNNNQSESARIGFVVSKKISNKAVIRNKIKRQLRAACRQETEKLKNGFDLVFFAKKTIIKAEFSDINQEVRQLLKKANLYA